MKQIQFTGLNFNEVEAFVGGDIGKDSSGNTVVAGPHGPLLLTEGCWITKNSRGIYKVNPKKERKGARNE